MQTLPKSGSSRKAQPVASAEFSAASDADRDPELVPEPASGFRQKVRHLHRLGPRPVGEILAEILLAWPGCRGIVLERLDRFADLDPIVVDRLGAADWLDQRQLVRAVAGSEP